MTDRRKVFAAIDRERNYQDGKWGAVHENVHSPGAWIDIAMRKINAANKQQWLAGASRDDFVLGELLQAASVLVACLEYHGVVERSTPGQSTEPVWTKEKPTKAGLYWVYDEVTEELEEIKVVWWRSERQSTDVDMHWVAWVWQDREYWELSEFDWFQAIEKPAAPMKGG